MTDKHHTILCVDDEGNILSALKRSLRKEKYNLLLASSGTEALKVLSENEVQLVMSDQRMPGMDGTEFLSKVKEKFPDVIRIILTGYTDVDSITEAINQGNIYKFFLKPWNDQHLKLEIEKALEQYDLIQTNKQLHETVVEQNTKLLKINENLESLVQERTMHLEVQNRALELSHAILESMLLPIIGVSAEGMIVFINREVQSLSGDGERIELGKKLSQCFTGDVEAEFRQAMETNQAQSLKNYRLSDTIYHLDFVPLSDKYAGRGIILSFTPVSKV